MRWAREILLRAHCGVALVPVVPVSHSVSKIPIRDYTSHFTDLTYALRCTNWDHWDQGRKQTASTGTNTGSITGTYWDLLGHGGDTSILVLCRSGPYSVSTPENGANAPLGSCQTGTIDRTPSKELWADRLQKKKALVPIPAASSPAPSPP